MILHEFGTYKIDFLYIRYYLAAKIDFTRKPILAAPDLASVLFLLARSGGMTDGHIINIHVY